MHASFTHPAAVRLCVTNRSPLSSTLLHSAGIVPIPTYDWLQLNLKLFVAPLRMPQRYAISNDNNAAKAFIVSLHRLQPIEDLAQLALLPILVGSPEWKRRRK